MYIDDGLLGAELGHALRAFVTDVELQARVFSRNHELFHDELLVLRRGGRSEQANREQERKRPRSSHERPPPGVSRTLAPPGPPRQKRHALSAEQRLLLRCADDEPALRLPQA